MRHRNGNYGNRNICGAAVERLRKHRGLKQTAMIMELQKRGVEMSLSGYSRLEGQMRLVSDTELAALADIFDVSVETLLKNEEKHTR